jgi:hypothetical protein
MLTCQVPFPAQLSHRLVSASLTSVFSESLSIARSTPVFPNTPPFQPTELSFVLKPIAS